MADLLRQQDLGTDHGSAASQGRRRALKPPFRWPGGKRWLVPRLLELIPQKPGRYFEPFFGAGALFFALRPSHATISDRNPELMACFRVIRDRPSDLGAALAQLGDGEKVFYTVRRSRPSDPVDRAARFIHLVSLAFNGIYRENRRGEFNVPYSGRTKVPLADPANLAIYSEALREVDILDGDFAEAVADAGAGDLVYLDPPYTVDHDDNGFVKYNGKLFSWGDQERLAAVARGLHERGCVVIVSSAHHGSTEKLFSGFRPISVARTSTIAADASRRGVRHEYVFTNMPGPRMASTGPRRSAGASASDLDR